MKAVGLLVAVVVVAALAFSRHDPRLVIERRLPSDLAVLAQETWGRFIDVFDARRSCIPDLVLVGSPRLGDRGQYRPNPPTVAIRYPATMGQLRETLVHEFAHHLEFGCPAQIELRAAFRRAQRLPAGLSWFTGTTWERTPSEQFAEAVVALVLGDRWLHRRMHLDSGAVAVVEQWGSGHDLSVRARATDERRNR